jgi:hypothetical protein
MQGGLNEKGEETLARTELLWVRRSGFGYYHSCALAGPFDIYVTSSLMMATSDAIASNFEVQQQRGFYTCLFQDGADVAQLQRAFYQLRRSELRFNVQGRYRRPHRF